MPYAGPLAPARELGLPRSAPAEAARSSSAPPRSKLRPSRLATVWTLSTITRPLILRVATGHDAFDDLARHSSRRGHRAVDAVRGARGAAAPARADAGDRGHGGAACAG